MNGLRQHSNIDPNKLEDVEMVSRVVREELKLSEDELPTVGIICGSGLGGLADQLINPRRLSYRNIPAFPESKVPGHRGELVYGELGGKRVLCQQGRFHHYEGHSIDICALPVRVMKQLGVQTLIITNAAGGINRNFKIGDLMLIKDHIFLPALCSKGPLFGPNDDRLGPRFVSLNNLYDRDLRALAKEIGAEQGIQFQEGVFVMQTGPQFESPAEVRMLSLLGGDACGMSVCHEAVVARHSGIKVFAMSLITNISEIDSDAPANSNLHEEVLAAGKKAANVASAVVKSLVGQLPQ